MQTLIPLDMGPGVAILDVDWRCFKGSVARTYRPACSSVALRNTVASILRGLQRQVQIFIVSWVVITRARLAELTYVCNEEDTSLLVRRRWTCATPAPNSSRCHNRPRILLGHG